METTLVCVYCGKKWPKVKGDIQDIPDSIKNDIREHIQNCPEHPLVKRISALKANLINAVNLIRHWQSMGLPERLKEHNWEVYKRHSPEMKDIIEVLKEK